MLLCSPVNGTISNRSTSSEVGFNSPDKIEDYERADFEKFNSPAKENKLAGTKIYIDGIILDIDDTSSGILFDGRNEWRIAFLFDNREELEPFLGRKLRIFGIYDDCNSFFGLQVTCLKFTDFSTGEAHYTAEYISFPDDSLKTWENVVIEAAKLHNEE